MTTIVANDFPRLESPVAHGEAVDISGGNHTCGSATRAIWVGTGGNVKVTLLGGTALTITNVQDGTLLPIRATLVWQTGTTASNMTAFW